MDFSLNIDSSRDEPMLHLRYERNIKKYITPDWTYYRYRRRSVGVRMMPWGSPLHWKMVDASRENVTWLQAYNPNVAAYLLDNDTT